MLLGLLKPTGGRMDVVKLESVSRGLDVRRAWDTYRKRLCSTNWMTVGEIGWFAAGFRLDAERSTSGYQYRYNELIRGFGLPPRQEDGAISKGMRAKVSLSLALASDPDFARPGQASTPGSTVLVRRDFLESMVDPGERSYRTVLLSSIRSARSSEWPATSPFCTAESSCWP